MPHYTTGTKNNLDVAQLKKWIKKMWYIYTMEYHSAVKSKGIMNFGDKWMELENIILSEVTQSQKHMHSMH